MKKPRKRKPGTGRSVSMTDRQWNTIKKWAAEAGMSASRYFAHCMQTVDLSSKNETAHSPVLTPERQRGIARIAADLAQPTSAETSSRFGELARDLLQERLDRMVAEGRRAAAYEGLCTVFGEQRAEIIAAAMMPPDPAAAPERSRPCAFFAGRHRPDRGNGGPRP